MYTCIYSVVQFINVIFFYHYLVLPDLTIEFKVIVFIFSEKEHVFYEYKRLARRTYSQWAQAEG